MYTLEPDIDKNIQRQGHPGLNRLHIIRVGGFIYGYSSWYAIAPKNSLDVEYGDFRYSYDSDLLLAVL